MAGEGEVIQHLGIFSRPYRGNRLYLDDDSVEANEIDVVIASQGVAFVVHLLRDLTLERDVAQLKLDGEGIAIDALEIASMEDAVHFHRGADDLIRAWVALRCHGDNVSKMRAI